MLPGISASSREPGPWTALAGRLSLALLVTLVAVGSPVWAQSLPAGWNDDDIGAVGLAGSASYSSGVFTVRGAGADIWGAADSFNFANQILSGDGQVVVRVASMGNTHTYAKAGVMFRESLTAGSRHVVLDMKPGGGVEFMARSVTGGSTSYIGGGAGRWLKLVRRGSTFTAYVSADGAAWTSIGSRSVTMAANAWVGLVVCSHNTGVLNTATFDRVTVGDGDLPPAVAITSPAAGAAFSAGADVTVTANATDTDATPVAEVEFYANGSLIGRDTSSPYSVTWADVPAGSYSLTAVATDTANLSATSRAVAVTVSGPTGALPTGWADTDIGTVGLAGAASHNAGTFTVRGAGADIWGTADSFHFANRALSGDGQITARVASMDSTHAYAKAGVMIRETLTAGSRHVLLDMKPSGGVEFMARAATGGSTSYIAGGTGRWLRLVRSGSTFTAYVSADGATWRSIGSRSVTMNATVWVGLAVCSHNTGVLNTSLFDNVTVSQAGIPANRPPTVTLTSPTVTIYTEGTAIPLAATATDADASPVARVQFYAHNGTTNLLLATDTTSPYTYSWSNAPVGPYRLTAVAIDTANLSATSNVIEIFVRPRTDGTLPGNWSDQGIGVVGVAGDAGQENWDYWVHGAGTDIWGTADSFNFASTSLSGDGQIMARVESMDSTHAYAKAGVMIRESSATGSRHVLLSMRPNGAVEFLARAATGGQTTFVGGGAGSWLKLVRRGTTFTAYASRDALSWTAVGSTSIAMPSSVRVGLAVCSRDTNRLNRAVFDNLRVGAPTAPGPLVTITSPAHRRDPPAGEPHRLRGRLR